MKHLDNDQTIPFVWRTKTLTAAVLLGLMMTSASVNSATNGKKIGDLEIYRAAVPGTAGITMMLDLSGSMGEESLKIDYDDDNISTNVNKICSSGGNNKSYGLIASRKVSVEVIDDTDATKKTTVEFTPSGCVYNSVAYLDRLSRMQIALMVLFADKAYEGNVTKVEIKDKGAIPDSFQVGLGAYSYNTGNRAGSIAIPMKALSSKQRVDLVQILKTLKAGGGTPTPQAYAEAASYMMSTTTVVTDKTEKFLAVRRDGLGSDGEKGKGPDHDTCMVSETFLSDDPILGEKTYGCAQWSGYDRTDRFRGRAREQLPFEKEVDGITYYYATYPYFSGFSKSVVDTQNATKDRYSSTLDDGQCSGNGIYLLTDGEPKNTTNPRAFAVMNKSLEGLTGTPLAIAQCETTDGLKGKNYQGWGCMGEYAKLLRNANNPSGYPLKTATVGFGTEFAGLKVVTNKVNGKDVKKTICESADPNAPASLDALNLCRLGDSDGIYGKGGFYYTNDSEGIANSVISFAAELTQTIDTAPAGTITIPEDPYQASNQLPYAYLPMLDPDVDSASSIWAGNLKKYNLNQGTLFGKSNSRLYKNLAGDLNGNTQDLWQEDSTDTINANNNVDVGGVYARLRTPSSGLGTSRNVYVEDYKNNKPILVKLSVGTDGKPVNFDALVDPVYTNNVDGELNKRRLLSFLGFEEALTAEGLVPKDAGLVKDLVLSKPTKAVRVLGGVVHSKPTTISYGASLDANGRITTTRDDAVLFGSMDGALHIADAKEGIEEVAIIPKYIIQNQPRSLVKGSLNASYGSPYFGVDAPWLVTTDYRYDLTNKKVALDSSGTKGMYAYGGLRMGGEAFYGMNISKRSEPEIVFSITPQNTGVNATGATVTTGTSGFSRLGQIWSKPTAAKIRMSASTDPIDVLIFGGGYDMAYEDSDYVATTNNPARGNAIYMINAKTGALIQSVSGVNAGSSNNYNKDMIHSMVGEITALDRDNDGLVDHIYAADLGGQVFRVDLQNARPAKNGFTAVDTLSFKRIERVLDASSANRNLAYRFYERPVVSFYRGEGVNNNGKIFAMVNVISGNRSSPLSKLRDNNLYADRLYGIIDSDVTDSRLYNTGFTTSIKDLTEANLVNLSRKTPGDTTQAEVLTAADKIELKAQMISGDKKGWFYPLTRFDGYNNVRYTKGIGPSVAINSLLYTTVYNPDKQYGSAGACAAKIVGGSERQVYCLPYGICNDDISKNGTGGFVPAGQGIQELTLGAFNEENTNLKVLIGTTTITDRILNANRVGYSDDSKKNASNLKNFTYADGNSTKQSGTDGLGDGSAAEYIFNERYTFQPRAWYERQQ